MSFEAGDNVQWDWGDGTGSGTVKQIYTDTVTKTIKGTDVTRNATSDDPAYLIEQADGDRVLKSGSELEPASSEGG